MENRFAAGERRWQAGLGRLREAVRQELVTRQLREHVPGPPARVLDIGCGQGTQVLRLARGGHQVIGLDASARLLARLTDDLAAEAPETRARVRAVRGDAGRVAGLFGRGTFDVVLCHGVLMYLPDPEPLIQGIAEVVRPGGLVSLLVRNGDALAMRPGLLGDWATAARAFGTTSYRNRIGVAARADRRGELSATLARHGLPVRAWYGVRVFSDSASDDAEPPAGATFDALLDCEERAGRMSPYRDVAALLHLVAVRTRAAGPAVRA